MRCGGGLRPGRLRSPQGDVGILLVAAGAAAVCVAVLLLSVLLDLSVTRGRAQTAADAAALAAVTSARLVGGDGEACAAAARLAALNGAALDRCVAPGDGRPLLAQVRVVATPTAMLLGYVLPDVTAEAAAVLRPAGEVPRDRILSAPRSLVGVAPR
jgi:hypothetical protein